MRPLVVIESPYAGEVEKNVVYARRCMMDSLLRGEAPFASHLLYTQILDDNVPSDRSLGIGAGWEWHRVADLIVFYTDRGWSRGMIEAFRKITKEEAEDRFIGLRLYPTHVLRALDGEPIKCPQ